MGRRLLRSLGVLWLSPSVVLVWALYVLPLWALGKIEYRGAYDFATFAFCLVEDGGWYDRMWQDWAGWAGPCVLIHRQEYGAIHYRTIKHELRHCNQQLLFGVFHYPLYILASCSIWAFFHDRHPYLDNPFERDARRHAGQRVDFYREEWPNGGRDRWPWW